MSHWEHRPEPAWKRFQFNQPYAKGLARLKRDVLGKTDFDPATLWQWGTMQAMALIEVLADCEAAFGEEGQRIVYGALRKVGLDVGRQILDGTTPPHGITEVEFLSFYASVINRIAYASLEEPRIDRAGGDGGGGGGGDEGRAGGDGGGGSGGDEGRAGGDGGGGSGGKASFDILWCPHQDHYGAFDCRVQRYFVQGMMDAAREHAEKIGVASADRERESARGGFQVRFDTTIPAGAPTCHFTIWRASDDEKAAWAEYTRLLERKALERAGKRSGGEP